MKLFVTIQSANRPYQVAPMLEALQDFNPVWYVPASQAAEYAEQGAKTVGVDGLLPMKPKQLNQALNDGFSMDAIVVTMDDDYVKSALAVWADGKAKAIRISLDEMLHRLISETMTSRFYLGGIAGTTNPLFANEKPTTYGMITGQIFVHKPNDVRFDESLCMLEDLDYIIQHHITHGGIHKNRDLLPEFHILGRSAKSDAKYDGGYNKFRTEQLQIKTLNQLQTKYPNLKFENQGLGKSVQRLIKFKELIS